MAAGLLAICRCIIILFRNQYGNEIILEQTTTFCFSSQNKRGSWLPSFGSLLFPWTLSKSCSQFSLILRCAGRFWSTIRAFLVAISLMKLKASTFPELIYLSVFCFLSLIYFPQLLFGPRKICKPSTRPDNAPK